MTNRVLNVPFLCTCNSARSFPAKRLRERRGGNRFRGEEGIAS